MMKKIAIIAAIILLGLTTIDAMAEGTGKLSLTVNVGARNFSESLFEDIYPDTPITFGIDLGYKITGSLEAFLHTDYMKADGKTIGMEEDSTFKLTPLELGVRYLIQSSGKSKLNPYLGAGLGYYMIKEDNPIGNLDEKKLGFFGEGGLRFYVTGAFFLDAKLKYVMLKSDDSQNMDNLDGLLYMAGLGISF
jgi:outer membrane protein W